MPAAGRKRVEGGLPILSQSVAIGRNRSRLVAIGRDWSRLVAIGRNRSRLVAIGRAETKDKAPKKSRLVAIGRDWSRRNKRQGANTKKARFHNRESGCITSQGVARS